jgi:putative mRNA 3-end processing factor
MIEQDFLVLTSIGLYCKAGDFYLDPQQPVRYSVVSHAHADHAVPGSLRVYATPATIAFMQLRYKKNTGKNLHTYNYSESFELNGIKITFLPAGHILGSAQILMEYKGIRYLYTGDFKLQKDDTCESFCFQKTDVLITETTFADPAHIHPPDEEEITKLNGISGRNIVIGTYVLGKAQRLSQLISRLCPDKKMMIHYSILPFHHMYKNFGIDTGKWEAFNRREFKYGTDIIYLVPPLAYNTYALRNEYELAFASGWENLQTKNETKLYISDHADWNELLSLVEHSSPKEVWTLHGNGSHLKEYLQTRNLNVKILN